MYTLYSLLALVLAYLLGSISFAVVVSRAMRLADPRSYGSGNPGATNVLRSGNRLAAALTLFGDAAKGWLAVILVRMAGASWGVGEETVALAGLAAFVGHLFPLFHGFRGGKGVATAAGVLLALHPLLGAGVLVTWMLIAFFFRYSSLAAIVAAIFAPLWDLFVFGPGWRVPVIAVMSALLLWGHRQNIVRLLQGRESRIGAGRSAAGK